tara:strand:+ start:1358 stop:1588 length:231 start_codon:yes stop_codon:yes gene_type:complete
MNDKQKRVVDLMRKKNLNKQANEVEKLTTDQFNKLMDITWNNNLYGTDCYRFLSDIKKTENKSSGFGGYIYSNINK